MIIWPKATMPNPALWVAFLAFALRLMWCYNATLGGVYCCLMCVFYNNTPLQNIVLLFLMFSSNHTRTLGVTWFHTHPHELQIKTKSTLRCKSTTKLNLMYQFSLQKKPMGVGRRKVSLTWNCVRVGGIKGFKANTIWRLWLSQAKKSPFSLQIDKFIDGWGLPFLGSCGF